MYNPNMGSRGSRTYDSNGAKPIERSTTARPAPSGAANPLYNTQSPSYAQPSFFQRHPFLSSFGAGLAGSWLGHMLFGSSAGHASSPAGGTPAVDTAGSGGSGWLTILIVVAIGFFAFKFLRRSSFPPLSSGGYSNNFSGYAAPAPFERGQDLALSSEEAHHFATALVEIQTAWSHQDLEALKRLCTTEMLGYFRNILNQNTSQGVENKVEDVTVLDVQIQEAWQEDGMEYATVLLTWKAKDYTAHLHQQPYEAGYLVEGDADHPVESTEVWTYVRYAAGAQWLLSAIQQR